MTQHELDRDLVRVTGETSRRIRHMGFTLIIMPAETSRKARKRSIAEQRLRVGSAARGGANGRD